MSENYLTRTIKRWKLLYAEISRNVDGTYCILWSNKS